MQYSEFLNYLSQAYCIYNSMHKQSEVFMCNVVGLSNDTESTRIRDLFEQVSKNNLQHYPHLCQALKNDIDEFETSHNCSFFGTVIREKGVFKLPYAVCIPVVNKAREEFLMNLSGIHATLESARAIKKE